VKPYSAGIIISFFLIYLSCHQRLIAQDQVKINTLLQQVERAKSDSIKVYLLVSVSSHYLSNDVFSSLKYGELALEIAEKSNDKKALSHALFNLGIVYFYQGLMELSIPYFFRFLEISEEIGESKSISYALVNIGAIYLNLKQYEKAQEFFIKALESAENDTTDSQNFDFTRSIYNNLGIIAKENGEMEKAIEYFRRAVNIGKQSGKREQNYANALNNLGGAYRDLGRMDDAIEYLNEALNVRLENNDKSGIIRSYLSLAKYYEALNNTGMAFDFTYNAISMAEEVGTLTSLAEAYDYIYNLFQAKQAADSALKYHILLTAANEKLNKEAAVKELSHMEITARYKENQRIMQLEQQRREQRYLLLGLVMAFGLAILGLLHFLAHSRNKRLRLEKENMLLAAKNLELEKSNLEQELDMRNKELTTNVMYQIQKNELINEIVQKMQKLNISGSKQYQSWVMEIIKDLEKTQHQSVWNEFEIRFQQVHKDFYDRLNEINPELSPNERRLSAFLRLNMSTKEISSITGQSARSIEVARTRLRKKLDLTNSETGLVEFLSQL